MPRSCPILAERGSTPPGDRVDTATFDKWSLDDVHLIRITGVLDFPAAVQLRLALYGCVDADAAGVVVDLSRVTLLDASSINVLLAVQDRLRRRDGALLVTGACGLALRALEITGAAKTLTVDVPLDQSSPDPADVDADRVALEVKGWWGNAINELIGRIHDQRTSTATRRNLRDRLIWECLPFTERLAHRFYGLGEPMEDLNQVATVALIQAIDRFNPATGTDFAAYATPTIVGALKRHFRDLGWTVRPPRPLQELRLEINRTQSELAHKLNRTPGTADIASHLRVDEGRVREAMTAAEGYRPTSLDAPVGTDPDASTLIDLLGNDEAGYDAVVHNQALRGLLATLPDREQAIISMRFYGNMNQCDIAERIGISQMHVSRLLTQILTRFRRELTTE